jgi:hypothetical protein
MVYSKSHYQDYFKDRVGELKTINHKIWGFVGAASLLEYVTQLINNGQSSAILYKQLFASPYMDPKYASFTYLTDVQDLPVQMYHIYRCGLLHSFSLLADSIGRRQGARDRSIVFNSLVDTPSLKATDHCTPYTQNGLDACRLILEPLLDDIGIAIDNIFADTSMDQSIQQSATDHPPFLYS